MRCCVINRSSAAASTPPKNAKRSASSSPNSRNATTIDNSVNTVRSRRRQRFAQSKRQEAEHQAASRVSEPLSRCRMRLARAAARGSCVTMTMVLPCFVIERVKQVEDFIARLAVEIAGRLVAQQDARIGDDRARDADALFLAAGQLARLVLRAIGESDQRERRGRALCPLRACRAASAAAATRRCERPSAPAAGCTSGTRSRRDRRASARARHPTAARVAAPRLRASRCVGRSSPPIRLSNVVLPEPDGPMSARKSPARHLEINVVEHVHRLRCRAGSPC